jgi:hypothetical protein
MKPGIQPLIFIFCHPNRNTKEALSMPEHALSPLARLALLMICVSIAGGIVAGAHYYAIDLPAQKAAALQAPANDAGNSGDACATCELNCRGRPNYYDCMSSCEFLVCGG